MYKNTEDLQRLIDSLSKGEKRHFTTFFGKVSDEGEAPLFMHLYHLLENGESQSGKVFSHAEPRSKTAAMRRLYDNILRSLRSLHQDTSVDIAIQNLLTEIELLYDHSLAPQGLIKCRKAYALANKHEKYGLLLQVLDSEKRLNIVLDKPSRPVENIKEEEREVLGKLTQIMTLEGLYGKVMLLKRQYGFVKGEARDMLQRETIASPDMVVIRDCMSNKAIYYHNFILAIYHWMTFDHTESYTYSRKLLEENSAILPNDFINGILQHITSSVCLAKFNDTINGILFAQAFIEAHKLNQSATYRGLLFVYQATYGSIVHCYRGDRERIRETVQYIQSNLPHFEHTLSIDMKQIVLGNLMNACMALGQWHQVDELWDTMFNRHAKSIRQDIYGDLYLFRLFQLLHEKRYDLIPSAALSANRYFKKSDSFHEVELPVSTLLLKQRDYDQKETLREVLEEAKAIVHKFIGHTRGVGGFQEHYTRYVIWCDAILNDEPYYIAAKRWYEGFSQNNHRN